SEVRPAEVPPRRGIGECRSMLIMTVAGEGLSALIREAQPGHSRRRDRRGMDNREMDNRDLDDRTMDGRDMEGRGMKRRNSEKVAQPGPGDQPWAAGQQPTPDQSLGARPAGAPQDRKSTRLNSSHVKISYAVFC